MSASDPTPALLGRIASGDPAAIDSILAEHLAWIRALVERRIGAELRRREEPEDLVQDVLLDLLRDGPRFVVGSRAQFRGLMARLVENGVRDRLEWHRAHKRDLRRERSILSSTTLILDPSLREPTRPSQAAMHNEREAWVQLALELIGVDDRRIILMREWEAQSFGAIGTALGIPENTARMRFNAALRRLAERLRSLRDGRSLTQFAEVGTTDPHGDRGGS